MEVKGNQNSLLTNILQNHRRTNIIQVWKGMGVSKWCQNLICGWTVPLRQFNSNIEFKRLELTDYQIWMKFQMKCDYQLKNVINFTIKM